MTQTTSRTLRAYGPDHIYIDGLTKGPNAGWSWDGHNTLNHPGGTRIVVNPAAAHRISTAVAAYREPRVLTGVQLQSLPVDDRDGWEFSHIRNEVHGMYRKGEVVPGTCVIELAEVVSIGRAGS